MSTHHIPRAADRGSPPDFPSVRSPRRPEKPVVGGVDAGGTNIKALLIINDDQGLDEYRAPTLHSGTHVAERVADAIHACMAELAHAATTAPAAIGLVAPGIVDEAASVAVYSENLGWHDAPLREMLVERCDLPVAFGHDVRTGGLAEVRIGISRGHRGTVFTAVGTGVAAGLDLDGWPYGGRGYAGESGYTDVGHQEQRACGATGCLEAIASAAALARRYSAQRTASDRLA